MAQTQDYLNQHPDHQVIKSDVKSYYASIDHTLLNEQLQQLLPNEGKLHHLLWSFMRRTVEFGGNYREVEQGLPLGASLSPLFAALYLSPLDELAKNIPNTFYRRYMDDWVWVFPKKQGLRKALKQQYGVLQALRVAMHPDKTFIGKASKGFDFLGFHLTPTGVTVSDTALSRHEDKMARLYEQGAKPKRIRAYRLWWLVWALLIGPCTHAASLEIKEGVADLDIHTFGVHSFVTDTTWTIFSVGVEHALSEHEPIEYAACADGTYSSGPSYMIQDLTQASAPDASLPQDVVICTPQGSTNLICDGCTSVGSHQLNLNFSTLDAGSRDISYTHTSGSYFLQVSKDAGNAFVNAFTVQTTPAGTDTTGPTFTSGGTTSFQENGTDTVYTAVATDATKPVTYALTGGADQSKFSLTRAGVLTFQSSPDFESPGDAGGDNVYNVEITASDNVSPANTTVQNVAITVTDDTDDNTADADSITLSGDGTQIGAADGTPGEDDGTDFGAGTVGGTGETRDFVIGNTSGSDKTVNSITIEETGTTSRSFSDWLRHFSWWQVIGINNAVAVGASDFTVVTVTPFTIANGTTETFTINFTPTAAGLRDGIVVVTFSDGSTFRFTISGNGSVATLETHNIPVFGPLGLLAMLLGLLWFGNRRNN